VCIDVGPQARRACICLILLSLIITVEQESAELAAIQMVNDGDEEIFVEFEAASVLLGNLEDAVEKLEEDRGALLAR